MTQTEKVYRYMLMFGSITPLDAMREFSIMRLAARIADLKHDGVKIIRETEHSINKMGEKVHYSRYRLG